MKRQKEISAAVGAGANLIQSKIPIEANITVSTPLKDQLKSAWMIGVFMNSNMGAIDVFLSILAVKLIYSLLIFFEFKVKNYTEFYWITSISLVY